MRLPSPVHLAAVLFATCILGAPLAAQVLNLLKPDAWKQVSPKNMTGYVHSASAIGFIPFSETLEAPGTTGVEQTVEIPEAGTYALEFCNVQEPGPIRMRTTGYWSIAVEFAGTERLSAEYQFLASLPRRFTAPQKVTVRVMIPVTNWYVDFFAFQQPRLRRVVEPATRVVMQNWSHLSWTETVIIEAEAHMLFVSLRLLPAPVTIPGAGLLRIDPSMMAPVGWSTGPSPKIRLDLSPSRYWQAPWWGPPLHFQAVDLVTGRIGSMAATVRVE